MKFSAIVCYNGAFSIGKDNKLLYKIKSDMARFKFFTEGNVVIMGKNTFDSIGKPLPKRTNIVLVDDPEIILEGCHTVTSIQEIVALCETEFADKECFVIGGASVYKQFIDLGLIDHVFATEVMDAEIGDTFFPNITNEAVLYLDSGWIEEKDCNYLVRYVDYLL